MDVSAEQLRNALYYLVAFVISVSVHEFGHAFMADKLGDGLPRAQGRLTLSPLAHYDLIGTIIMPLIASFTPGLPLIAWGKPVRTNVNAYKGVSPRTGHMLVALMGPAMNLVLAVVVSIVIVALGKAHLLNQKFALVLIQYVLALNLTLLFFNLIPLPPLDGGAVLEGILPDSLQIVSQTLRRYGIVVFYVLLLSGAINFLMRPASALTIAWARALLDWVPA
ncbi:MAG TPA: site-2 protease family protein [Polyangia bacterium]|nr:site-2 protease family protein [Polyangia bacterium]